MKPSSMAVLKLLRTHRHSGITALQALEEAGTFRLAARIADLKSDGYRIETEMVETPRGKHIACYRIVEPVRRLTEAEHRALVREEVAYVNRPMWSDEELLIVAAQSGIEVQRA